MNVNICRDCVLVSLYLGPRFLNDDAFTPAAKEAWQNVPDGIKAAAVEEIKDCIAAQIAEHMAADVSAVRVVVLEQPATRYRHSSGPRH